MNWDDLYDRFYEWADSTKVSRISSLTSLGDEDSICEIAAEYAYLGNKECTKFLQKVIALGGTFSAQNIMELIYSVEPTFIWELVQRNNTSYSADELDELYTYLTEDQLKILANKGRIHYQTISEATAPQREKPHGFGAVFSALFGTNGGKDNTRSTGHRCNGDCANCPPHYGYRYGRWYYGNNHTEGCEFGGNNCNGGKD